MQIVIKVDALQHGGYIGRVSGIISPDQPENEDSIAAIFVIAPSKDIAVDEVKRRLNAFGFHGRCYIEV
jgi:hypothetical protein